MGKGKKSSDDKTDLTKLSSISPDSITSSVKEHYQKDAIYLRINHTALVAINPYKELPIFSDATVQEYVANYKDSSGQRTSLPPHAFQLASQAYLHMRRTGQDQSIILSGESGSGKSETRKLIVKQLIALSAHQKKAARVQSQVPCSEFILESFGNVKTTTNINASRFGKYTELQFNERGRLIGAKTLHYLLEKNRLVSVPPSERNFHVFYYLLAGASPEEKTHLHLTEASQYRYLNVGKNVRGPNPDDTNNFNELKQALKSLGFHKRHVAQMFQLLAAILHMGNIQFAQDLTRQQSAANVKNIDVLDLVADFLGVDARSFETVLTYKTKLIKKEMCTVFLNAEHASDQRDDLAKALYSLLFSWIVEYINTKLCQEEFPNFIGILDLIGFQNLAANSLDQFCVNFANEKIHNFVLQQIFEVHQNEYKDQGISSVPEVPFFDNTECFQMLAKSPNGLIAIMEDQSNKSSKKTDQTMLDAFNKKYSDHNSFTPTGKSLNSLPTFGIQHFIGQVTYDVTGFLEKNVDNLSADFIALFRGGSDIVPSYNSFITGLFTDETVATEMHPRNNNTIIAAQQSAKPMRAPSIRRKKVQSAPETTSKPKVSCVATQLQSALDELCETFEETTPWHVFCIRPNDSQLPNQFDQKVVKSQVRSFGLAEIAKKLKVEYTIGFTHEEFLERYSAILSSMGIEQSRDPRAKLEASCTIFGWGPSDMVVGLSKTYLSENAWRNLEDNLRSMDSDGKRRKKETQKVADYAQSDDGLSRHSYPSNQDLVETRRPSPPRQHDAQSYVSGDDHSYVSEDDYYQDDSYSQYEDNVSAYGSEVYAPSHNMFREMEMKKMLPEQEKTTVEEELEDRHKVTSARKKWVFLTWALTWCVPPCFLSWCGGMKRKDIRMAWREKVALCILILFISAVVIFIIAVLGELICPRVFIFNDSELQSHNLQTNQNDVLVSIRGEVFSLTQFAPVHYPPNLIPIKSILNYGGSDATTLFPIQVSALCAGADGSGVDPSVTFDFNLNNTKDPNAQYHDFRYSTNDYRPDWYFEKMRELRAGYLVGQRGLSPSTVSDMASSKFYQIAILNDNVYDLTAYVQNGRGTYGPGGSPINNQNIDTGFMSSLVVDLFQQKAGQDVTKSFNALPLDSASRKSQLVCLRNLFYVGKVDHRNSPQCLFSRYILLVASALLVAVIAFKFLAALQLGPKREPEEHDKFVVCQIPCYTEGEDSLRKTLDSLAVLRYDDKRKLLFIVCDGMIVGSGNDRPTPRIVLDILGGDPNVDPEPLSFLSLGDGAKQHNMGKVYSGLYECSGHVVPYLVVVKVGKPTERVRPGNRGKRDSQMVLMRFLNKVHFNSEMTPLELEMYHQIKNVIGVNPSFYEYVLMVDADTEVMPDSLNRMVSAFMHDTEISGLCGETTIANEKDTWVTMIQVYEYYISHHLAKAFESLFGSVTCLPGCFCMYRIRSPDNTQKPLLIANDVINDYSENVVDTLHKKNLLHLGEDRYLTTLIMKHFPRKKLAFVPDAQCKTYAPDQWSVLLSQRRRWINSTVHNLMELMFLPQLCGFCCFSMRFVVMLDLFATLVMPATVGYIVFLIYSIVKDPSTIPVTSLMLLAAVYGLQAIIFILRRKWEHVGWMIVYIFAIPVFSFFLPLYAFWHFDDFSWGNTRVVVGEKGKKILITDEGKFDPKSIPKKKWSDYEDELWEVGTTGSQESAHSRASDRSYRSHRSAKNNASSQAGSVYGGDYPRRDRSPAPPYDDSRRSYAQSDPRLSRAYSAATELRSQRDSHYLTDQRSQRDSHYLTDQRSQRDSHITDQRSQRDSHYLTESTPGSRPISTVESYFDRSVVDTGFPSDEEILQQVRNILSTANLMSVTKKQVRDNLAEHFGVSMGSKKEYINSIIELILQGKL